MSGSNTTQQRADRYCLDCGGYGQPRRDAYQEIVCGRCGSLDVVVPLIDVEAKGLVVSAEEWAAEKRRRENEADSAPMGSDE